MGPCPPPLCNPYLFPPAPVAAYPSASPLGPPLYQATSAMSSPPFSYPQFTARPPPLPFLSWPNVGATVSVNAFRIIKKYFDYFLQFIAMNKKLFAIASTVVVVYFILQLQGMSK